MELLVVMGIMIILLSMVVPATVSLLRGSQLGQGGDLVAGQLELARQTALARNRTVQVRFCQPTGGNYTAIMTLLASTNTSGTTTYTAMGKPLNLPTAVLIDSGNKLSTVLNPVGSSATPATSSDLRLGNLGTAYQYVTLQFKPDGSTDLISKTSPSTGTSTTGGAASSLWFLTVHNATDGDPLLANPPTNYYTIQIDAYNGHLRQFRP